MTVSISADATSVQWLRELASHVDYAHFRRVWLHPVTEQAEQGFIAACYENVARRANSEGEYFLAHDAANHGLRCAAAAGFPPHQLTALKATALARSGATGEAQRVLEDFLAKHEADGSVCSARARLSRDLALAAGDSAGRRRHFREGAKWAARAMDAALAEGRDWAYPANQEVEFLFLAGVHGNARKKALRVMDYSAKHPDAGGMWSQANLAEMNLVRGDLDAAGRHYRAACKAGASNPGDLAACRSVARLLLDELRKINGTGAPALLDKWFPQPVLVVFAGHIPDAPGRPAPRLPEIACRMRGPAARSLARRIARMGAVEGICAAAPGGDVLFAEALLAAKGRLTLVEPFPAHRVREVAKLRGHDWPARLEGIYEKATRTESIACAEDADEPAQCDYANRVMLGSAMLRAKRINARLHALALWDEADADSPKRGGTGHFVALCREAGVPVEIINPRAFST